MTIKIVLLYTHALFSLIQLLHIVYECLHLPMQRTPAALGEDGIAEGDQGACVGLLLAGERSSPFKPSLESTPHSQRTCTTVSGFNNASYRVVVVH